MSEVIKPSIESILVPDEEAKRRQIAEPDALVVRQFNDRGKAAVERWFRKTFERDPSLELDLKRDDYFGAVLGVDGVAACREFCAAFDMSVGSGGAVVEIDDPFRASISEAFPWAGAPGDDHIICRRKIPGFDIRSGPSHDAQSVEWMFQGLIPAKSSTGIIGELDSCKSMLALSLGVAAAYGLPWMGHANVAGPQRVLYFDTENGTAEMARRGPLLGDSEGRISRVSFPEYGLGSEQFWNMLPSLAPDLVLVDSYGSANQGIDENSAAFAAALWRMVAYVERTGASFVTILHSGKSPGTGSLSSILRGSSALGAALDAAFFVKRTQSFKPTAPREHRGVLSCKKMRRGGQEPAAFSWSLTDSGMALCTAEDPKRARKATGTDEERVLAAVRGKPGIGGARALAEATGLSRERVALARKKLLDTCRVENRGSAGMTRLFLAGDSPNGVAQSS